MKYIFRFQSLLEIRKHEEKVEKQKLASITRQLVKLIDRQERIQRMIIEYSLNNAIRDSGSIQFFKAGHTFLHQQREKLCELEEQLQKLKKEQDRQRKRLMEANRNVKKMQKIREKDRKKFIFEQERYEQLQLNEIASQMHIRTNE